MRKFLTLATLGAMVALAGLLPALPASVRWW